LGKLAEIDEEVFVAQVLRKHFMRQINDQTSNNLRHVGFDGRLVQSIALHPGPEPELAQGSLHTGYQNNYRTGFDMGSINEKEN
jgi:hypothetical protein